MAPSSSGWATSSTPAKAKPFPAGSFAVAPAKMNHFAIAKTETVVEVAAIGPFVITYVNPADDPSKTAAK